jgi:hypothetical protein
MTLPQREIVHAEDLRGTDRGAGSAADHPQQRIPTHQEAEVPTEPHPSRPTQGEAHGEEAGRQSQRPPRPRRHQSRQPFGKDVARACGMTTEELTDPELPRHPVTTPREVGQRPGVATMDVPGQSLTGWAAGCRLCGRDQEDDLGLRFINAPSIQLERCGLGQ